MQALIVLAALIGAALMRSPALAWGDVGHDAALFIGLSTGRKSERITGSGLIT